MKITATSRRQVALALACKFCGLSNPEVCWSERRGGWCCLACHHAPSLALAPRLVKQVLLAQWTREEAEGEPDPELAMAEREEALEQLRREPDDDQPVWRRS